MREICLSNSDKIALVSDCDYEYVSRFSWHVKQSRNSDYIAASVRQDRKVKTVRLHRLIATLAEMLDTWNKHNEIHHLNRDRYDCRRENLESIPAGEHQRRHHKERAGI